MTSRLDTDGPIGEGVNSDSRTWFDGMFQICNQGKEDACVSYEAPDDLGRDDAELIFYYDGDTDGDRTTSGRVDIDEGDPLPIPVGQCVEIGLRTETFDVDATDDAPLFDGEVTVIADVDQDCFEEEPDPVEPECPTEETWDEIGDEDEAGGPVILMGLDSELNPGDESHGPAVDHANMVASLLGDVTNGQDEILVLGGNPDNNSDIEEYWDDDLTREHEADDYESLDEDIHNDQPVDFVYDETEMEEVDFDDYAMLGIVSSTDQISWGLTDDQNEILDDRAGDIADFVNAGGGLLGKTQEQMDDPWAYADPFGDFENRELGGNQYDVVEVLQAGLDLGLTQDGMSGWCCYHETFPEFPDFFDTLLVRDDGDSTSDGEAGAIGGSEVIVERQVSLAVDGIDTIVTGEVECYDLEIENRGDEAIDGSFEVTLTAGSGSVSTDGLPDDEITLDSDDPQEWEDAICIECDGEGPMEVDVEFVDDDGARAVSVTMDVDCVDELPEGCE